MNEITPVKLSDHVYCMPGATNIGIIDDDDGLILIDTGVDRKTASNLDMVLSKTFHKKISSIINTHSNADHAGGNKYFFEKYNCKTITTIGEKPFIENPFLQPALFWGGNSFPEIEIPYFKCEACPVTDLIDENSLMNLKNCTISFFSLPGHYIEMIAVVIKEKDTTTVFLGDGLFGAQMIQKYNVTYILKVSEFLKTLDKISTVDGNFFIPSHGTIISSKEELQRVINMNKTEIYKVQENILSYCKEPMEVTDIIARIFEDYHIKTTTHQWVLIGTTIRNHLSDLRNNGKLNFISKDGRMFCHTVED